MAKKVEDLLTYKPDVLDPVSGIKNGDSVLAIDFETTGLSPVKNCIYQYVLVMTEYHDGEFVVTDSFNALVNPDPFVFDPGAADITGYNNEMLKNEQSEADIFPIVYKMVKEAKYILWYNGDSFDSKFLEAFFCRQGHPGEMYGIEKKSIDGLLLARELIKKDKAKNDNPKLNCSHKLENMAHYLGCEDAAGNFHDALKDTLTTILVVQKLLPEYWMKLENEEKANEAVLPVKSFTKKRDITVKRVWTFSPYRKDIESGKQKKFVNPYRKTYLKVYCTAGIYCYDSFNGTWKEKEKYLTNVDIADVIAATLKFTGCKDERALSNMAVDMESEELKKMLNSKYPKSA